MKKMKRIIALIAAVLLMTPQTALAAEQEMKEELIYPRLLEEVPEEESPGARSLKDVSEASLQRETELYFTLEERLKEALLNGQTSISLSDLQISAQEYSLHSVLYFSPYLSNGIDVSFLYSTSDYNYVRAEIKNSMSAEETRSHFTRIDQKVATILARVSDGMSDAEKMLAVHDYFVYEYAYDQENYEAGTIPADSYRSGGLFINGVGVCQAYAYGYQYILSRLGLECYVTSSTGMNHAWNIVGLDGKYYHVDCTWDDPVVDRMGMVRHTYFLLSDETIKDPQATGREHYGWDLQSLACTDKSYEDEYWNAAESKVVFDGDAACYIKDQGIYRRESGSGTERKLADLGRWYVWGNSNSFWTGAYSGLSDYDGYLYYNTSSEIRRIAMDGSGDVSAYKADTANGYVYGSKIAGGSLQYVIKQNPSDPGTVLTAPVSLEAPEPESIVLQNTELQLTEGETAPLDYYLVPETAASDVEWKSDDAGVASVDQTGKVTAAGEGKAVITVTTSNGKTAECQVTVAASAGTEPEPDKGANLDHTMTTLDGKSVTTKAEGKPKLLVFFKTNCYNSQSVMRILQDEALNFNGIDIIACDASSATEETAREFFAEYGRDDIECCFGTNPIMWDYLRNQGAGNTVTMPVLIFINRENRIAHYTTGMNTEVVSDIAAYLGVDVRDHTTISLDRTSVELTAGDTEKLTYRLTPESYQGSLEWSSSNPGAATVEDGTVTAVAEGSAVITVRLDNGSEATCQVTVRKKEIPIEAVRLDQNELTLKQGATAQLTATITPENTTDTKGLSWSSSDESVAAVYQTGVVTAVGEGTATITVKTVNGKEASCRVVVESADPESPGSMSYTDVAADGWYYDAVQYAYDRGVMTGLNDTTFGVNDPLARAQFAVILHRLNGTPAMEYTARFHDVGANTWYTDAILWAESTGVVTGYSNGNFGPADNINREQMALMMFRYAGYKGYDNSARADFSRYQDGGNVSGFAGEAMQWAVGEGIITGKYDQTVLDPQGEATRAECATIIMRFMEKYEQ